ncbi:MAG TPA: orotate phosphoribosyltransferase [Chitinivibrionales bacterium]|nr:orotate phosphoribosyltransferase [Chitinivibrionales bacterium]
MEQYKQDFITFMVKSKVLTFGDFTTKSGRKTPYFINTGNYQTGSQMAKLGEFYAQAILAKLGKDFNVLFGPAYKGIPLAVSTAVALSRTFGHDVSVCFNRKEAKDHGEGGTIIGHKPAAGDNIVIVDDVITAGTSVRESAAVLSAFAGAALRGLVVSVDRMEKGRSGASALLEAAGGLGMAAAAIVTIEEIVAFLHHRELDKKVVIDDAMKARIDKYRAEYGV